MRMPQHKPTAIKESLYKEAFRKFRKACCWKAQSHDSPEHNSWFRGRSGRLRDSGLLASPDGAVRSVLEDDAELLQLIARRIGCLPVLAGSRVIALLHESLDLRVAALIA